MSKNHRGSGIRSLPAHGRGTCAICGKTDIKVLKVGSAIKDKKNKWLILLLS